jgi:redox-sensing transcriptional repressor
LTVTSLLSSRELPGAHRRRDRHSERRARRPPLARSGRAAQPLPPGPHPKRGVGYNVDSLVSQIRKILRTAGQHNIALFGAGHLGRAIAGSHIFADHGFRIVSIFDTDPGKLGEKIGDLSVRPLDDLTAAVKDDQIVVGVLAVPGHAAQQVADDLVAAGVTIIFNYSEALLQTPPEVTVHTSSPAVDLLYALYFYLT